MSANYHQLRREMARASRLTFSVYREQHPADEFFAFALYTDDDAGGANAAANTEEAVQRATRGYSDAGYEVPELGQLRYIPDEWAYTGAEGCIEVWTKVWELNNGLREANSGWFSSHKEKVLKAMILSLKDLDVEGFFGVGDVRERITLLIWITDSYAAKKLLIRSVEELNPPIVYERFLSECPSWL